MAGNTPQKEHVRGFSILIQYFAQNVSHNISFNFDSESRLSAD